MSGHSKWATTKHRKGAQDAKRSALFSKLSRNITVAARLGGDPLPENNASLAAAVAKAKAQSMPKDKIKSAIDKAFGSGADAAVYENIVYEGYGPAGVAVYVDCLTATAPPLMSVPPSPTLVATWAPPAPSPSSLSVRARLSSPRRSWTRTPRRRP